MDFVYLITYKKHNQKGRYVLEVADWKEVVDALLALGLDDAECVEVFKAQPV